MVENNTYNGTNDSEMKNSEERSKNNNNNNNNNKISTCNQVNANKNIGINNQCKSTYLNNKEFSSNDFIHNHNQTLSKTSYTVTSKRRRRRWSQFSRRKVCI